MICFALMTSLRLSFRSLVEDREDVVFAEEHELFAVDLHLGARVLAEEDLVARLHVERDDLPVLHGLSRSDGHDEPLEGLLLGGIGDDDAALRLLFFLRALDDETILEGTN